MKVFLSSTAVWLSFWFFFVTTMAFGILQNFAPAILREVYGVSLVTATGGLTAYLIGSGAGMIVGGFVADRGDRMVAIALGIAEALNATVFGLSIAVPTLIAFSYFSKKVEVFSVEIETLVVELISKCYYGRVTRDEHAPQRTAPAPARAPVA